MPSEAGTWAQGDRRHFADPNPAASAEPKELPF
jgi:hypothetical protein